jgi:sorting nexin-9/18/33
MQADLPPEPGPILMQTTGERMMSAFPSFRQSLLGGKTLNRFSSFVTSGAEAYVLKGPATVTASQTAHERGASDDSGLCDDEDDEDGGDGARTPRLRLDEADRHFVDAGPTWRAKVPPFRILVHSPAKRSSSLSGSFTVYSVTSLFHLPPTSDDGASASAGAGENYGADDAHATRITVHRRFSHFVVLHTALTRRLPGIALPPLPEKQYAGRFNDDFVEARRGDLERYLGKVVRHPVARYAEILTFFLGCESELVSAPVE